MTLVTCCGPSSAARKMRSRSTWRACQCRVLDPYTMHTPLLVTSSLGSNKEGSDHHGESEMYVCDLCNRSFSTQGSLKRHREPVHQQSAGFSCQVCSTRFYRKDVLQRYLKTRQPAELLGDSKQFNFMPKS